jgi:hypothetical protein
MRLSQKLIEPRASRAPAPAPVVAAAAKQIWANVPLFSCKHHPDVESADESESCPICHGPLQSIGTSSELPRPSQATAGPLPQSFRILEQYEALDSATERATFYRAHKTEMDVAHNQRRREAEAAEDRKRALRVFPPVRPMTKTNRR